MPKWVLRDGKLVPVTNEYIPRNTLHFSVKKGGFNQGLGQYIGSRSDKRNAVNRIYDETGQRLQEVGNEQPCRTIPKSNYEFTGKEMHKLNEIIDGK